MSRDNVKDQNCFGSEKIDTEIITLTRFLTEEQTKHKEATGDFTLVKPTMIRVALEEGA